MAASKTAAVVWNDVSHTSGTTTSSSRNLASAYLTRVAVRVTNGGTGPTAVVSIRFEESHDGTNWFAVTGDMPTDSANSAVTTIPWTFDGASYYRIVATGGGTNAVTLRAEETQLTA